MSHSVPCCQARDGENKTFSHLIFTSVLLQFRKAPVSLRSQTTSFLVAHLTRFGQPVEPTNLLHRDMTIRYTPVTMVTARQHYIISISRLIGLLTLLITALLHCVQIFSQCWISPVRCSDHQLGFVTVHVPDVPTQTLYWHFNVKFFAGQIWMECWGVMIESSSVLKRWAAGVETLYTAWTEG